MATTHMVHARKRGQALVEMAITLPLIVTLMLGAADLGRAFYLNIEMAGASRAGMREGIKGAWEFGPLLLSPFLILAIYLAVAGIRIQRQDKSALPTGILALLLTAIGYFLIYVLAPYELAWELHSSLTRLTLQLWPGIVFVVFLAARSPEREPAEARVPEPSESLVALSPVD